LLSDPTVLIAGIVVLAVGLNCAINPSRKLTHALLRESCWAISATLIPC